MTSVIPEASTATPDPSDQRAAEPTALYRLYNADGALLYIGVTDNPERRFKQHRDTKPWWPQVAQKTTEWCPTRLRALAEEATAIEAEAPIYNLEHNPAAPGAVSPHHPPVGMPAERVDALRKAADGLPAHVGEGLLRAGFGAFARAQLDERAAPSTPAEQSHSLTPAQVCDLPMAELLARVNAKIGEPLVMADSVYAAIDTSHFFGYLVSRNTGPTLHIRSDATEHAHDIYVRYLLTQHLGLPTHLFPDELQHTVFVGPELNEVQA
jgi:predicted GIY-YIG superfamily endonuclease